MKGKIGLAIHGGAGDDSEFLKNHQAEYLETLELSCKTGYRVLERGGSATDAVEEAVVVLEDSALFNSGRGSALNQKGEIEMDASIMQSIDGDCGSVATIKFVKNPIKLARAIMTNSDVAFLSDQGALDFAKEQNLVLEPATYFITEHQKTTFDESWEKLRIDSKFKFKRHGTVGAVALDQAGNLASAVSTGGTTFQRAGRIGDSAVIGAGNFCDKMCAIAATGDGEAIIKQVFAYRIISLIHERKWALQQACNYVVLELNKGTDADIGLVSIDVEGNFGITFNCERMPRGWISSGQPLQVAIYK